MSNVEHPNATVPDSVDVPRVGALRYEFGFPAAETSQRFFDEMDFQRAVQAYLWGYPAVSFESIRLTSKQNLGIDFNDLGIADNFVDPSSAGDIPERWPSQPCQLPTRHRISGRTPEARAARRTTMTFHAIGMTWAGARPSIVSADLTKAISCAAPKSAHAETPTEVIQVRF